MRAYEGCSFYVTYHRNKSLCIRKDKYIESHCHAQYTWRHSYKRLVDSYAALDIQIKMFII